MKDLNAFTASVYEKAEHKKKQFRSTIVTAAVVACAALSVTTAIAVRPQLQRIGSEVGVTATSAADPQTLQSVQNLLTAPSDPHTAGHAAGREETHAQAPAGTTARNAANSTVPATAAQAGEPGAESGDAEAHTTRTLEFTITEIYREDGLQPTDGTPTVTKNMLLHEKDIIAAAYNALDPVTRSAADPADAFVVTTHDARETADGFEVYFKTDAETVIVRLDEKLNLLGITRRPLETATVSGAYNPNN